MPELFDPMRHEALTAAPWCADLARAAIERICAAAESEFDDTAGNWPLHPQDEPEPAGARSFNLYWGATGVVWALRHLAVTGAVQLKRDYARWIERYPDAVRQEAAAELHGTASYFFGESAPLLLAWLGTGRSDMADRLHAVVQGNQRNSAQEPLWGNSGTVLAAIRMAEARGEDRWTRLVAQSLQALVDDMTVDPETGTWLWEQDLYGKRSRHLGAGHGLSGNAYAVLRGAAHVDAVLLERTQQRVLETLSATALHDDANVTKVANVANGAISANAGPGWVNWYPLVGAERIEAWLRKGGRPLVQDCHGAPGIVCRLAGAPRSGPWDALLRGAGELTWHAGPLRKGPSLCHGSAGSAMTCLKLWRRFGEPAWLERARQLALHAAAQVEAARARHGQGRHSLWTGDMGVACVLWNCVAEDDRFPTLDHF